MIRPLRFAALVWIGLATTAGAAEISGRIELLADGKPAQTTDVRYAVVYFKPKQAPSVRPLAGKLQMEMRKKEFVPRVLAVTQGTTVRFPNADPVLHNVFSVSGESRFDLGLYPQGAGRSFTFANPGLVRVYCNVHQEMAGYILVLDTPYFAMPEPDGRFHLAGLPDGEGTLVVWHERTEPWTSEMRLPAGAPVAARLEITKPQVPLHLNKFGKPYQEKDVAKEYR